LGGLGSQTFWDLVGKPVDRNNVTRFVMRLVVLFGLAAGLASACSYSDDGLAGPAGGTEGEIGGAGGGAVGAGIAGAGGGAVGRAGAPANGGSQGTAGTSGGEAAPAGKAGAGGAAGPVPGKAGAGGSPMNPPAQPVGGANPGMDAGAPGGMPPSGLPPNPPPVTSGWQGPPLIVGVGYGGRHIVSTDGLNWTGDAQDQKGNAEDGRWFQDAAYAGGLLVAVGGGCAGGCQSRITTFDGAVWKDRVTPPGLGPLSGVAFGNGTWIAVGPNGPVATSKNGKDWLATGKGGQPGGLRRVAFGQLGGAGMFIAVGDNGLRVRSSDGLDWRDIQRGFPGSDVQQSFNALVISNGTAVVGGGGGRRLRSKNGTEWTDPAAGGNSIGSITFGDGRFVAFAEGGVAFVSTDDAKTWTPQTMVSPPGPQVGTGMLGSERLFVGASWPAVIKTSPSGIAWTTRSKGADDQNALTHFVFAGN
jgi:hypothetical protein